MFLPDSISPPTAPSVAPPPSASAPVVGGGQPRRAEQAEEGAGGGFSGLLAAELSGAGETKAEAGDALTGEPGANNAGANKAEAGSPDGAPALEDGSESDDAEQDGENADSALTATPASDVPVDALKALPVGATLLPSIELEARVVPVAESLVKEGAGQARAVRAARTEPSAEAGEVVERPEQLDEAAKSRIETGGRDHGIARRESIQPSAAAASAEPPVVELEDERASRRRVSARAAGQVSEPGRDHPAPAGEGPRPVRAVVNSGETVAAEADSGPSAAPAGRQDLGPAERSEAEPEVEMERAEPRPLRPSGVEEVLRTPEVEHAATEAVLESGRVAAVASAAAQLEVAQQAQSETAPRPAPRAAEDYTSPPRIAAVRPSPAAAEHEAGRIELVAGPARTPAEILATPKPDAVSTAFPQQHPQGQAVVAPVDVSSEAVRSPVRSRRVAGVSRNAPEARPAAGVAVEDASEDAADLIPDSTDEAESRRSGRQGQATFSDLSAPERQAESRAAATAARAGRVKGRGFEAVARDTPPVDALGVAAARQDVRLGAASAPEASDSPPAGAARAAVTDGGARLAPTAESGAGMRPQGEAEAQAAARTTAVRTAAGTFERMEAGLDSKPSRPSRLNVVVHDDRLGRVSLRLVERAGLVDAMLRADQAGTARTISDSLSALADSLARRGLESRGGEFSQTGHGGASSDPRDSGRGRRQGRSPDGSRGRRRDQAAPSFFAQLNLGGI